MSRKCSVLILWIFCALFGLISQCSVAQTLEVDLLEVKIPFALNACTENRLLLYRPTASQRNTFEVNLIDSAFNQIWSTTFQVSPEFELLEVYSKNSNYAVFFFQDKEHYKVMAVDLYDGAVKIVGNKLERTFTFNGMDVMNDQVYFYGSMAPATGNVLGKSCMVFICLPLAFIPNMIPDRTAMFTSVHLGSRSIHQTPPAKKGFSEFLTVQTDTTNQKVYAIENRLSGRKSTLFMHTFRENGIKSNSIEIKTGATQIQFIDAMMVTSSDASSMLLGAYAAAGKKSLEGFFTASWQNQNISQLITRKLTQCSQLMKAFDEEGYANLKKSGYKLLADWQILMHPVCQDSLKTWLLVEFYMPQYHREYRTIYVNGFPQTTSYEVFDGYKTPFAALFSFDRQGNMFEEEIRKLNTELSYTLDRKMQMNAFGNGIVWKEKRQKTSELKYLGQDAEAINAWLKSNMENDGSLGTPNKFAILNPQTLVISYQSNAGKETQKQWVRSYALKKP